MCDTVPVMLVNEFVRVLPLFIHHCHQFIEFPVYSPYGLSVGFLDSVLSVVSQQQSGGR